MSFRRSSLLLSGLFIAGAFLGSSSEAAEAGYAVLWRDPLKPEDVGMRGKHLFKPGMSDWSVTHGLHGSRGVHSTSMDGVERLSIGRAPDGRPALECLVPFGEEQSWGFRAPALREAVTTIKAEVEIWIPNGITWSSSQDLALAVWGGGVGLSVYGGDIPPSHQDGFSIGVAHSPVEGVQIYSHHLNRANPLRADGSMPAQFSAGGGALPTNRWVRMGLEVRLNDIGAANGWARLSVDGQVCCEMNGLVLRDSAHKWGFRGLLLQDRWRSVAAAVSGERAYWYSRYTISALPVPPSDKAKVSGDAPAE